jgi:RNase P/RNase MRP subunit p30
MAKYVKHLSSDELLERLADELVEMHNGTYIELSTWETAREVVERFYEVDIIVAIGDKKKRKK